MDSTQGVQAQTLSTAKAAAAAGLKLVPVVTKIDLPHANVDVSFSLFPFWGWIAEFFSLDHVPAMMFSRRLLGYYLACPRRAFRC